MVLPEEMSSSGNEHPYATNVHVLPLILWFVWDLVDTDVALDKGPGTEASFHKKWALQGAYKI